MYVRYQISDGEIDTPDRTVTPRRVLAKQQPQNFVFNHQSLLGQNFVNEAKIGYNAPQTSAVAFGAVPGYDPAGVSLSGTVTSSSVDARGTSGIARSGLLIRASSAASTVGSLLDPRSISLMDTMTWTRGAHTMKGGFEYRNIESQFQFLGSTEITYNSITDFIDNRPAAVQVALDSPVFTPQQIHPIGFMQDSWRATDRLTLDLGLRYDFYSVVKEKDGLAKPFFVEDNAFSDDPDNFYNPDKNNFSPRLSATYAIDPKTALRAGFGIFYGPGQFEDRIQPIENYIERRRVQAADIPSNGLAYPVRSRDLPQSALLRGYTHDRPDEYNMQYGVSVSRELPGAVNLTVGYTGEPGQRHVPPRRRNTLDFNTRLREAPAVGQVDYKTSSCVDSLVINCNPIQRMRLCLLQCAPGERDSSVPLRLHRWSAVSVRGTRGRPKGRTRRLLRRTRSTMKPVRHEPAIHSEDVQRFTRVPGARQRILDERRRVGGIINARSGVPINVVIARPDNVTVGTATPDEHPGWEQPRHAAAGRGCREWIHT